MVYYNTVKRLFKNETDRKSTEQATRKVKNLMEEYGKELIRESSDLAEHAERKTIKEKDVDKAKEKLKAAK